MAIVVAGQPLRAAGAAEPWRQTVRTIDLFALGAGGAFVFHEMGHVAVNLSLGNVPHLRGVDGLFGIPFVAISPEIHCTQRGCVGAQGQRFVAGRRGRTAIAAAGFAAQFASSEAILSSMPDVLYRREPLLQGWLAFNVALAVGYAATCYTGVENAYGDATGVASHAGLPRAVVATGLIVPTALDIARAIWPHHRWLAWASRASKVGFFTLVIAH